MVYLPAKNTKFIAHFIVIPYGLPLCFYYRKHLLNHWIPLVLQKGQFQAESAAGRPAGGAARSSLVAGLKRRDKPQHPGRLGMEVAVKDKRYLR